jgi:hypothetical protein
MADQQQAAVPRHGRDRVERLPGLEAASERRVHRQPSLLLLAPCLRRQLGSLSRAHTRAEQHDVERPLQTPDGDAGCARLFAPPLGQAALGVRARAMRLGLRVTK